MSEKSKCFGSSFSIAHLMSFCKKCKHKALLTRRKEMRCFIWNGTQCPSCPLSFNLAPQLPCLVAGGYCHPCLSSRAPKGIQTLFRPHPVPTALACPPLTPNWRHLQSALVISWSTYVTNKSTQRWNTPDNWGKALHFHNRLTEAHTYVYMITCTKWNRYIPLCTISLVKEWEHCYRIT